MNIVFQATTSVFNTNYLNFLNTFAIAINRTIDDIAIIGLKYGSVQATIQIDSVAAAGTQASINEENAIRGALSSNSIANMQVSSSTVTTNGGSNSGSGDDDTGLSRTTIIILAVCIPCGVLSKFAFTQLSWPLS